MIVTGILDKKSAADTKSHVEKQWHVVVGRLFANETAMHQVIRHRRNYMFLFDNRGRTRQTVQL